MIITGKIVSGAGQGAYFTRIDWVIRQCYEKLGFKPFPGTLNLEIGPDDLPLVASLDQKAGIEFISPDPQFCNAKAFAVQFQHINGAIIMPAEEVRIHAENIVEIIAPLNVKVSLNVRDGDSLAIRLLNPPESC